MAMSASNDPVHGGSPVSQNSDLQHFGACGIPEIIHLHCVALRLEWRIKIYIKSATIKNVIYGIITLNCRKTKKKKWALLQHENVFCIIIFLLKASRVCRGSPVDNQCYRIRGNSTAI
jgi:hypothetical protein